MGGWDGRTKVPYTVGHSWVVWVDSWPKLGQLQPFPLIFSLPESFRFSCISGIQHTVGSFFVNQIVSIFSIFTQRVHFLFGISFTLISGPIFSLEVFLFLLFLIILVHGNGLRQEYERQLNEIWVGFLIFFCLELIWNLGILNTCVVIFSSCCSVLFGGPTGRGHRLRQLVLSMYLEVFPTDFFITAAEKKSSRGRSCEIPRSRSTSGHLPCWRI